MLGSSLDEQDTGRFENGNRTNCPFTATGERLTDTNFKVMRVMRDCRAFSDHSLASAQLAEYRSVVHTLLGSHLEPRHAFLLESVDTSLS
jgi:hypothetical protein